MNEFQTIITSRGSFEDCRIKQKEQEKEEEVVVVVVVVVVVKRGHELMFILLFELLF